MTSPKLAKRLELFPEYIFSRLNKEVALVEKETGRKVLNFGLGTPDFPPSTIYVKKLAEFVQQSHAPLYPGYGAIPQFRDALIEWYQKRFAVSLGDNEILPLLGAKDGVSHIVLALADTGEEILMPTPGYPGYAGPALLFGATPVFYNLTEENNFKISLDEVTRKITTKTAFMWVNFPSNPTGQVITHEELRKLIAFAQKHNLTIVYDNAYSEITFGGYKAPSILEIEGAKDIAVEIGSFSKMSSFAGFRMGWITGNEKMVAALAKVKSQLDSGLSLPLQELGAYALAHPDQAWHDSMITSYEKRRDIIAEKLTKLGLSFPLPQGSLYIWAKIPAGAQDATTFCMNLLHEKQVLLTPGSAFGQGCDRFVRVSICINIDHIEEYL